MELDRLEGLCREAGLAALVAGSPHGFAYFTGERLETQVAIPDRLAFATRAPGALWVTVCAIEAGQLAGAGASVAAYEEFADRPEEVLARQLVAAGLSGRVGYEAAWMPASVLEGLRRALAGHHLELVPADALFGRLWAVKSPDEIAHLERGAKATVAAIGASFTPGHGSEVDVAIDLASGILRGGAEAMAFMILASGPRALVGHPVPSPAPLRDGDVIRTDVGGRFGNYLSDLARTGVIGRGSPAVYEMYGRLADMHDRILGRVRPGVPARQLLLESEALAEAAGLPFSRHLVGHNIGILVHEWPILNAFEEAPLEAGMVLCIEHGAGTGEFRLHIENTGVVTADGFRLFTQACPWDAPLQL